ncbi:MAG: endonuclease/exonuclease/phosphatase family protein, partial [Marmoricola sp.]
MRAVRSGSGAPAAAVLVLVALLLAACSTTPERPAHRPPGSAASAPASPSPSGTSPSPAAPQPTGNAEAEFEVGTFNTLGASHTRPGGTMADRPPGRIRGRWAAQVLRRAGVDLVGLQEFEPAQLRAFRTVVHRTWALYPGLRHGEYGLANSVAWRRS